MENADYLATHKDYSESVDALERAIATLKKQDYDRTQLIQARYVFRDRAMCSGGIVMSLNTFS